MSSVKARWLPLPVLALFAAALVVRIVVGTAMWEPGWSALTWDDFTRVALAQEWADDPFLAIGDLVWLPIQTWGYGIAFALAGDRFTGSPMALAAVLNTGAVIAAAGLVSWSAWRMFRSQSGALLAFVVMLFSPWMLFSSLSGLNESFYYLAIAGSVAGLVGWLAGSSLLSLGLGAFAVATAAGLRYDGWTYAVAWAAVVTVCELGLFARLTGRRRTENAALSWSMVGRQWPTLAIAVAPLLVPAGYMMLNLAETGDPLHFARESARIFTNAFGSVGGPVDRLLYYPSGLLRSAPLLLPVLAGVGILTARKYPSVRVLIGLTTLHFGLFYGPSLVSPAVGAFPERFLFAFVIVLAPLAGAIPGLLRSLSPRIALAAGAALASLVIIVGFIRVNDPPVAWTRAPDLLELNTALGQATRDGGTLRVGLGPGAALEALPLDVQNGNRVQTVTYEALGTADPAAVLSSVDIWIERLPARVAELGLDPDAVFGRYHIYGPAATDLPIDTDRCGCAGWTYHGEDGTAADIAEGPYMALEFVGNDPAPGEEAVLRRSFPGGSEPVEHRQRVRSLWGHGFNRGRIRLEVRVDGATVLSRDIGERSRWLDIDYTVPAGDGETVVEIAVVAQSGIEQGWEWGRASTVLVTSGEADR